ncbi:hypothetical protein SAMN05444166_3510 [Singulisphaera sp. GP187]|uniref:hypothetical protein n=1 Tax=Singulisphaera sp. GP187 TaxID=1882752 RepID=UPI0009265F4D|nr:hypothetical protein [Singulisphaera sp. GP187]SIO28705.1 hypothetical protein SAMN05444166_3510 [Singulisphaera sp. GP187]
MRRTRAIAIIGLVLGLSGCAGTHQHQHFPANGPVPPRPTGLVRPGCACQASAAPRPSPFGANSPNLVPTVAARPMVPSVSTASRTTPPSPPPPSATLPPSSRPVAVPAAGGVVRYFPLYEGDLVRSVWDAAPPDFFGVRTSMTPATAPAADEDSPGPLGPEAGTLSLSSPELRELPQGNAPEPTLQGQPVTSTHFRERRGDVVPVSAVVTSQSSASTGQLPPAGALDVPLSGPDLAVGDGTAMPPKTLELEHADDLVLAGRPRWQPQAQVPLVQDHDQDGPSTWISELAFRRPAKPAVRDPHLVPMARTDLTSATARRTTVVSRFIRRVRVAGQAFINPDSVRRESGNLAEQRQGVERASTHRLGEPSQR